MKKVSVFITALLMMSFIFIPTNFVKAASMDEVLKNVEQTNIQINEEIEKAVYAAQEAFDTYNHDLMVLQKGKELGEIDYELSQLRDDLKSMEVRNENKSLQLKYEVDELVLELNVADVDNSENKIVEVNLRETLEECSNISNKNQEEIQKLEDKYIAEIDKIINDLLDVTNKMAAKMIEDAAKEGVIVYCEWVEVTLGGRNILVDPLRVGNE